MQIAASNALVPVINNRHDINPAKEAAVMHFDSGQRPQTGLRFLGYQAHDAHLEYDPTGKKMNPSLFCGHMVDIYV